MVAENLVDTGEAAVLAEGGVLVEGLHVENAFVQQIFFHAVNPLGFNLGEVVRLFQPAYGAAYALFMAQQFGVDAEAADKADNIGHYVLIAHLRDGGTELERGEALAA